MSNSIVFIASGRLPYPTGNGVSVLWFGLIQCLEYLGLEVSIVAYNINYANNVEEYEKHKHYLSNKYGSKFLVIEGKPLHKIDYFKSLLRHVIKADEKVLISNVKDFEDAEKALFLLVKEINPRFIVASDWAGIILAKSLQGKVKIIVSLVDMFDQFINLRKKQVNNLPLKNRLIEYANLLAYRNVRAVQEALLKVPNVILEHAFHHAVDLKKKGYTNTYYIPHPIQITKEKSKRNFEVNNTVSILIAGSLKGAASKLGFEFFLDKLLPEIDARLSDFKYPIHFRIIGHGNLPDYLRERLSGHPLVQLIGFVENISQEYAKADIMLVCIPVEHGFRTRIAESFGYGLCVVAHEANAKGMPEIENEENALISTDAQQLATYILEAANDENLRSRIGRRAKVTFKEKLSIDCATLTLDGIIKRHII